eukprot:UN06476
MSTGSGEIRYDFMHHGQTKIPAVCQSNEEDELIGKVTMGCIHGIVTYEGNCDYQYGNGQSQNINDGSGADDR